MRCSCSEESTDTKITEVIPRTNKHEGGGGGGASKLEFDQQKETG